MRRSEMLREIIDLEEAYAWLNSRNDNPMNIGIGGDGFGCPAVVSISLTKKDLLPVVLKRLHELNVLVEASKPHLPPIGG